MAQTSKDFLARDLAYFQREIEYIQRSAALYAQQYPKIARRLELTSDHITDPHVARLVESFAYVSGKLNREIDDEFPKITTALLEVLYPQFARPIPSLSTAQFSVDPKLASAASTVTHLPKGTGLVVHSSEGVSCRFQTCYDTDLWPFVVVGSTIVGASAYNFGANLPIGAQRPTFLRLRLRCVSQSLKELPVGTYRFYIQGSRGVKNTLLEMLFRTDNQPIFLTANDQEAPAFQPKARLKMVGFNEEDALLPQQELVHDGYRLMQEFFLYPDKFDYIDIENLDLSPLLSNATLDVLIGVEATSVPSGFQIAPNTLVYGCTPVVNIFKKLAEPIALDHYQSMYPLLPNIRDAMTEEIHTILNVYGFDPETNITHYYAPYYLFTDKDVSQNQDFFWVGRRRLSTTKGLPGTQMDVGFVDLNAQSKLPSAQVIYVDTLSTNRHLAAQLNANTVLSMESGSSLGAIVCLDPPTEPTYPPTDGVTGWKLITQLSLNQLSLSNNAQSLEALKTMLSLHASLSRFETTPLFDALLSMESSPSVRRFGQEAWRGFVRGLSVRLAISDTVTPDYNPFLLTAILSRFFALYVDVNSFAELNVTKRSCDGIWKQWNPLPGTVPLL